MSLTYRSPGSPVPERPLVFHLGPLSPGVRANDIHGQCEAAGLGKPAAATPSDNAAATTGAEPGASQQSTPPAPAPNLVTLHMLRCLSEGDDGTVLEGLCGGTPMVYEGDVWGLAAYCRESKAYIALASLQGLAVPQVMGHGQMPYLMRYVAMRPLAGRTLADVPRAERSGAVADAALEALLAVQRCCPGFVHGDVQLENFMLLEPPAAGAAAEEGPEGCGAAAGGGSCTGGGGGGGSSGGGGGPRCVLLDFARSRLDGDTRAQQRELAKLRGLLGLGPGGG
ncbi:hypothetical protein HYH03_001169 [Edaphochlamys debaryana]|uniref:Aminoglycoside phosphotransferase domain-containing protein n=1 Tax=Edaphochlamys debaryana TaxID=47281 RepID=A0A835YI45_9CHLO|nr:hypothetical protein HYH03_001169 [Edaphochlamys debaryana]|eukprot:KAG2501381.1 hypothetical protein HYH03_001169 [Edaphochlamys debaryana]